MKLLFTNQNKGYSWSHEERYYLCETQDEYDALVEKYKGHKNEYVEQWCGTTYHRPANTQVYVGVGIHCRPQTEVSDGYATYGGHTLDAKGIQVKHNSRTSSMDYSSYDYYIMPNSIERNEQNKTENWWV